MIPSILTATSHHIAPSTIKCGKKSYKFIMFTALIGFGSVGKSPAMEIVEEASYLIEKANRIDNENSQICSAGTIEGLVELLRKQRKYKK